MLGLGNTDKDRDVHRAAAQSLHEPTREQLGHVLGGARHH